MRVRERGDTDLSGRGNSCKQMISIFPGNTCGK
jgi:hypothetical protein